MFKGYIKVSIYFNKKKEDKDSCGFLRNNI